MFLDARRCYRYALVKTMGSNLECRQPLWCQTEIHGMSDSFSGSNIKIHFWCSATFVMLINYDRGVSDYPRLTEGYRARTRLGTPVLNCSVFAFIFTVLLQLPQEVFLSSGAGIILLCSRSIHVRANAQMQKPLCRIFWFVIPS